MTSPIDPDSERSELEDGLERVLGPSHGWSRAQRFGVGALALAGYLGLALFRFGFLALFLAIGFYGVLQQYSIEEPEPGQWADAHVWAAITFVIAALAFSIWWWFLGSAALQAWSTRVWLPLGIVSVALALDRYRRAPTATESIGMALGKAQPRRPPDGTGR
jgi:hypothetical protein